MNNQPEELIRYQPGRTLTPVMNLTLAKSRLEEFQKFVDEYMVEGEDGDYGIIPGTKKKTLFKPGADKLCELYGLADSYKVIDRLVDFDRGLFDYEIECTLSRDGMVVATGLGSCSSFEGKYRWRDSKQICPECGKETIIKGKEEYGGGWICFGKKGGCGAKFPEDDERITGQTTGQVENEDIASLKNTILKMAKKRAKVDATLSATRSSGVFSQDIGDNEGKGKQKPSPVQQPKRKSETQPEASADKGPSCPKCQSPMEFKPTGKWGPWWSCSTYPTCKGSVKDEDWQKAKAKQAPAADIITEKEASDLWGIGFCAVPGIRQSLEKHQIESIVAAFGYKDFTQIKRVHYDAIKAALQKGEVPTSDPDPGPQN